MQVQEPSVALMVREHTPARTESQEQPVVAPQSEPPEPLSPDEDEADSEADCELEDEADSEADCELEDEADSEADCELEDEADSLPLWLALVEELSDEALDCETLAEADEDDDPSQLVGSVNVR